MGGRSNLNKIKFDTHVPAYWNSDLCVAKSHASGHPIVMNIHTCIIFRVTAHVNQDHLSEYCSFKIFINLF